MRLEFETRNKSGPSTCAVWAEGLLLKTANKCRQCGLVVLVRDLPKVRTHLHRPPPLSRVPEAVTSVGRLVLNGSGVSTQLLSLESLQPRLPHKPNKSQTQVLCGCDGLLHLLAMINWLTREFTNEPSNVGFSARPSTFNEAPLQQTSSPRPRLHSAAGPQQKCSTQLMYP